MLNTESLQRIDREIAKYPADQKQSAVMAALAIAQEEQGWLSSEAIEFVAKYLGMAPIAAYEVASFYNMYDLQPIGRHKLTVCTNLPCMLSGGVDAGEYLKQKLGIGFNETTADVQATLLALSVRTITQALASTQPHTQRLIACGGGVHNPQLMGALAHALPGIAVESSAAHGLDPDFVEAMAFAWLARETLAGRPGNLPAVTGAAGLRVLGAIYPA